MSSSNSQSHDSSSEEVRTMSPSIPIQMNSGSTSTVFASVKRKLLFDLNQQEQSQGSRPSGYVSDVLPHAPIKRKYGSQSSSALPMTATPPMIGRTSLGNGWKSVLPVGVRFYPEEWELFVYLRLKIEGNPIPPGTIAEKDIYAYCPTQLSAGDEVDKMYFLTPLHKLGGSRCQREAPNGTWSKISSKVVHDALGKAGVKGSFYFDWKVKSGQDKFLMKEYTYDEHHEWALVEIYTVKKAKGKNTNFIFENWSRLSREKKSLSLPQTSAATDKTSKDEAFFWEAQTSAASDKTLKWETQTCAATDKTLKGNKKDKGFFWEAQTSAATDKTLKGKTKVVSFWEAQTSADKTSSSESNTN